MKTLYLLFYLIFCITSAYSQELTCSLKGTHVHFINGVGNLEKDAINSITEIELEYKSKPWVIDKNRKLSFSYTYNRSFGTIEDFLESGAQKIHLKAAQLGLNFSIKNSYQLLFQALFNLPSSYFPVLRPFIGGLINEAANSRSNIELVDVINIKNAFKTQLQLDKKLILISHSQGNLFTNRALVELEKDTDINYNYYRDIISNVRFATPEARSLASHSIHITNSEDFINRLSDQISNYVLDVPPAEHDLRPYLDTFANHGFLETYLFKMADIFKDIDPVIYNANLSLTALRNISLKSIEEIALRLDPHPRCPKAVINYNTDSSDSLSILLDSTDPEDPDIQDLLYVWAFDDGTIETTTSKTFPRVFSQNGQYLVRLTVTTADNADFGPDANAERDITVGKTLARGCSGKAQGYYHTNPNGSTGGFVAETATVEATVHVGPSVSICGTSKVLGNSFLSSDDPIVRNDGSEVWDSTISNTSIDVNSRLFIHSSNLSNLTVAGDPWVVYFVVATITDSIFTLPEFRDAYVQYSTVTNSSVSGYSFWIGYSTIVSMNFEIDRYLQISGDYITSYGVRSGPLSSWPFY